MRPANSGTGAEPAGRSLYQKPFLRFVLTAQEMREADLYTSEVVGIPSMVLMERAALAVADRICEDHKDAGAVKTAVISGTGNNGADGIAAGRILSERGYPVRFFLLSDRIREGSQCRAQLGIIEQYGYTAEIFKAEEFLDWKPDVVIDAMFGIGLTRDLEGTALEAAASIAQLKSDASVSGPLVYAVDIPSGVSSDDSRILGDAVKADVTVTFGFLKRGHLMYPGAGYCGEIVTAQIGITEHSLLRGEQYPQAGMFCYQDPAASDLLPARKKDSNKGTFGKALLIAGSRNMAGAALLAGESAALTGCGMVRIMTPECNRLIVQTSFPEALLTTYPDESDLKDAQAPIIENANNELKRIFDEAIRWADTVLIGPGLGRSLESISLVRMVLETEKELRGIVIDADALRIIASDKDLEEKLTLAANRNSVILTPHLAECADLMHIPVPQLKENIAQYVKDFADSHHLTLLCKDARSVAASWNSRMLYINTSGTDALAKAGTGDVLAGLTVSLMAQHMEPFEAACAASWLHGQAARVSYPGERARTLLAMDLARALTVLPGSGDQSLWNNTFASLQK